MTKSTKRTPTDQHRRFIETARALECDEDMERFEEKLKRIATAKISKKDKRKRAPNAPDDPSE